MRARGLKHSALGLFLYFHRSRPMRARELKPITIKKSLQCSIVVPHVGVRIETVVTKDELVSAYVTPCVD